MKDRVKLYFWVGNTTGYVMGTSETCPVKPRKEERLKYLGYTTDHMWPREMSTGRMLYKPSLDSQKKKKRKERNRINP